MNANLEHDVSAIVDALNRMDTRLGHIEESLKGNLKELGVIAKVNILWRSWIWVLCTASAGLGGLIVWLVERVAGP